MQRRRGRDPMNSLELGNTAYYSSSMPMRKLSKMKVVKYLILIMAAILIHTTYRLVWKTNTESTQTKSDIENTKKLDEAVDSLFREDAQNVRQKVTHKQFFKEMIRNEVNKEMIKNEVDKDKEIIENENSKEKKEAEIAEKAERYKHFKEAIERAKNEFPVENVVDEQKIIELDYKKDLDKSKNSEETKQKNTKPDIRVLKQVEGVVDKRQEALELEKEHNIESKIADILGEMRDSKEVIVEEKQPPVAEKKVVNPNFVHDNKPPSLPPQDKAFVEKANIIQQKLAPEIKKSVDEKKHVHGVPEIVTAALSEKFEAVRQLVYTIQKFYPKVKIYIFDLDLTDQQRRHLMAACNVRIREFWSNLFPSFVSNWKNYHWKPLVMQTALAEFGHIIWINPGHVVSSHTLLESVNEKDDLSIKVFGQSAMHTTFAVTEPTMYKYLSTDRKILYELPHMEISAILMHNTEEMNEKFMKLFVACAMEPKCMAPPGAKRLCDFEFSGKKYADCHRYDESAMNILLKNWYGYDYRTIIRNPTTFKEYDPTEHMPLKMCRDENDIIRRKPKK